MPITVGTYVLSDGTRAQPARVTGGSGARVVQPSHPIRSDAKAYDRKGRRFEETVEVSYTYATYAAARAGWAARRDAATAEPKGQYKDGDTVIGTGFVETATLVFSDGCGITIAYHITGELA